jgi:hypothetical protein
MTLTCGRGVVAGGDVPDEDALGRDVLGRIAMGSDAARSHNHQPADHPTTKIAVETKLGDQSITLRMHCVVRREPLLPHRRSRG